MIRLALAILIVATAPAGAANVCLNSRDIDRTSVPDAKTVLFHMKDGKVWKNMLRNDCAELKFNGFAYDASPNGEICGNLQTIRVLRSGEVCALGPFEPAAAPAK
jgi:hypothetical protein